MAKIDVKKTYARGLFKRGNKGYYSRFLNKMTISV